MTDLNIAAVEAVAAVDAAVETKVETRGRKHTFGEETNDKKAIAAALIALGGENGPSYYLTRKLIAAGYVETKKAEKVVEGRGRRPYNYLLTTKGKKLVSIAKNIWKMGAVETATE